MIPFPDIDPIAFQIGPFIVRWYALAYLAGFLGGWKYALWLANKEPKRSPTKDHIDDFLPWSILGVILGGRIGYVLFYQPALYAENPLGALKIWEGGMAFHGGALGVIVALIIYSLVKKIPLLRLSDIVAATVPIGLFFGRIANFINGELWGRPTDQPWGVIFPYGGPEARHPSQLYQAALEGLALFLILFVLYRIKLVRDKPGIVTGVFLAGYGIFRLLMEQFRQPDAHLGFIVGQISMGQILSLPMVLFGLNVVGFALWRGRKV